MSVTEADKSIMDLQQVMGPCWGEDSDSSDSRLHTDCRTGASEKEKKNSFIQKRAAASSHLILV